MKLLRSALISNALSCLAFGSLFCLAGTSTDRFLENPFAWLTPAVGAVLLFNGCHLLLASQRRHPIGAEVVYFVAGDFVWVLATLILVILQTVIVSAQGVVASLLTAAMVGLLGVLQWYGYRRACPAQQPRRGHRAPAAV